MKKVAFLEYIFMFDPSETWSHLYEFEQFLANALKEIGMEAEIVKTVGGQSGRGVVYIRKLEPIVEVIQSEGRPKSIKGIIKGLTKKEVSSAVTKFEKGRTPRPLKVPSRERRVSSAYYRKIK